MNWAIESNIKIKPAGVFGTFYKSYFKGTESEIKQMMNDALKQSQSRREQTENKLDMVGNNANVNEKDKIQSTDFQYIIKKIY